MTNFKYFHNLSVNQKSLIVAVAVHLILLFAILYKPANDDVPALSFSVTMDNNVSVSQNNISATTIAKASESVKKKEKVEVNDNKNSDKVVKKQEEETPKEKSKGESAATSQQQNAVFGKDSPAVFNAAYLNNPSPTYPPSSRKAGEQGKVLLNVYINTSGEVEQIAIAKSSGFSKLDNSALYTVKKWKFAPAKKGGQVQASWVEVPINFVLSDGK